ncbi:hypothetical protein OH492_08490 [Vibrio chagasii]|nr:hypothetical protein [Vibrio chagasii]
MKARETLPWLINYKSSQRNVLHHPAPDLNRHQSKTTGVLDGKAPPCLPSTHRKRLNPQFSEIDLGHMY